MGNKILKYFIGFILFVCFLIFSLFIFLFFYSDNLPYNFELSHIDGEQRIQNKDSGWPVITDNDYIAFDEKKPKIKYIRKYSTNKLGLVVYVETVDKKYYYVAIKPKPKEEQIYAELQVNYTIYTEQEYKKLGLEDNWHKIR